MSAWSTDYSSLLSTALMRAASTTAGCPVAFRKNTHIVESLVHYELRGDFEELYGGGDLGVVVVREKDAIVDGC